MSTYGRPTPADSAARLITARFPDCLAAFLAGSVIRGDATPTSDLDIVVIVDRPEAPFRESLIFEGWPVELFVHTPESARRYFASDAARRMPSLPQMVAEGQILGSAQAAAEQLKTEARALLDAGPEPFTTDKIRTYRYAITDLLDDLEGTQAGAERFFIAAALISDTIDLWLGMHGQWTGHGKWAMRALRRHDAVQANRLETALQQFCEDDCQPLIGFVEAVLAPVGGRLFTGFKQSGRKPDES